MFSRWCRLVYRTPRIARVARTSAARRARATPFASRALAAFAVKARAFGAPLRTRAERLRLAATSHPRAPCRFRRAPRPEATHRAILVPRARSRCGTTTPRATCSSPPRPKRSPRRCAPRARTTRGSSTRPALQPRQEPGSCAGAGTRPRATAASPPTCAACACAWRSSSPCWMTPGATRGRGPCGAGPRRWSGPRARDAAAERRDASEAIEREAKRSETARAETKTAREETRAFRDARDALRESAAVFKAEAIRREKETEAKIAVMERRLREREDDVLRKRVDVGTETRDVFGDAEGNAEREAQKARRDERWRSATRDAYEAGSRDGERRGREATLEASNATKLLAEAAQDAAHARAADAEARVATLEVRLERARAKAAAERKRAAAAETRRNEHEALCRLKVSAAADALAAAETREGVFRVRLEELLARNAFVARNPPKKTEPTGPPVGSFFSDARRAPAKKEPEGQKKNSSSFASSFARVAAPAQTPERDAGNPAPFAKESEALDANDPSSDRRAFSNAHSLREEKQGELPDWLPEVRPPPRMLA